MTDTPARPELVAAFRDLHRPGRPLLMPNPWDVGSARVLATLGYRALATTSSGFAATLGRLDGTVTREQALRHAADIVAATELPVSADLENGFAEEETGSRVTTRRSPVSDTMLISVPSLVRRARTAPSATAPTSWVPSPRAGGDQSSRVRIRPEARSTPMTPTGMLGATSGVGVAAWTPTAVHRRVGLPLA